MCEANAYLIEDGEEKLLMEAVDIVEPQGPGAWRLESIFGDQIFIQARIHQMNLVNHRILFKKGREEEPGLPVPAPGQEP